MDKRIRLYAIPALLVVAAVVDLSRGEIIDMGIDLLWLAACVCCNDSLKKSSDVLSK